MIHKTLHWYILRELLRNFFLAAGALTTLLAFGGTFKPLTKEGLSLFQLMLVLTNLMPAMLAYSIPLGALFAAVLAYWRIATDNEITACQAGGISFRSIVFPALALGLVVACSDLLLVHYVVPVFLQRTERIIRQDLPSLLVHNVGRQEPVEYIKKLVLYADRGEQRPLPVDPSRTDIRRSTAVTLYGLAAMPLNGQRQPSAFVCAKAANIIVDEPVDRDDVQVTIQLEDGAAFDPDTFRKISGTIETLRYFDGSPFTFPSMLRNQPKFLNFRQLNHLDKDLMHNFPPLREQLDGIKRAWHFEQLSQAIKNQWKPNHPMVFFQSDDRRERIELVAPAADIEPEDRQLVFRRSPDAQVRVDQYHDNHRVCFYQADAAELILAEDQPIVYNAAPTAAAHAYGTLQLTGSIRRTDIVHDAAMPVEKVVVLPQMALPTIDEKTLAPFDEAQFRTAPDSYSKSIRKKAEDLHRRWIEIGHDIGAERQSRASFATSCLMLVLLGAALGILMRGRNPLLVFVVGFVPAIVLVLLITAGRRMVETTHGSPTAGYVTIWAGNVLLLLILAGVYGKLLRQ